MAAAKIACQDYRDILEKIWDSIIPLDYFFPVHNQTHESICSLFYIAFWSQFDLTSHSIFFEFEITHFRLAHNQFAGSDVIGQSQY